MNIGARRLRATGVLARRAAIMAIPSPSSREVI
jgi:hypothetical protein